MEPILTKTEPKEDYTDVDAGLLDETVYAPKQPSRFRRMLKKFNSSRYSYLFYAFIIPVILNYIVYLSMGLHPFGNGSVLVLDLNGQYVYFYEALRNAVYGDSSLIYSFCRSLGGEFFGTYAYYVASPFSYIVCLFPQSRILEALLTIFLLKAGISGMTMAYYLDKISSKLNKINVVMFSVLYAMCSYAVVQQHNSMWIDALMWLPLLVLGIESLIKYGKYKLYTVMLALTLMSNFYIGYMCCIFTFIYFFYYYFSRNEKDRDGVHKRNNPTGEPRHFLRTLLRMGLFSVIGVGISMVVVATAYYSLQFGKNTFSNPDFSFSLRFDLMDFFTRFLPGAYDTVRPEGLPFIYCGILTVFCVPVYFFSKKFSNREKVFAAAILGVLFFSFAINTLDMIWHGFQKPNWLNYRYSFMMSFLLVVLGYKGFGEIRKVSGKVIAAVAVCGIFFVTVAQKFTFASYLDRLTGDVEFNQKLETLNIIWFSLLAFAVFGILLGCMIRTKNPKAMSAILCVFVCIEAFANAIAVDAEFGEDVIYSSYDSYNDFISALRPVCEEISDYDKGFYRYEKTAHRKYCDNMALNIRGITNSTSTLNKTTIEFLEKIGYAARSHWSKYLGGTPMNDSLIGMKYVIASEKDHLDQYYKKLDLPSTTYNGTEYFVYENPYALSLAYAVDSYVETYEFDPHTDSPMLRLNNMVSVMCGEFETQEYFKPVSYDITTGNCQESTIAGHTKYTHLKEGSDATITYSFKLEEDGEVFFYLPSEYWREVQMRVNGRDLGNFYASETSRIFSLGTWEAGQDVHLALTLDCDVLYVKNDECALFTIDKEKTYAALEALAKEQVEIGEGWSNTNLTGNVTTTKDNRLMQTSLTYDKGWKVYVDGKEAETCKTLGALVAFKIDTAGEHTVRFVYRPTCYVLGLAVTVGSALLLLFIIIFEKKLRLVLTRITSQGEKEPVGVLDADTDWDTGDYQLVDIFPSGPPAETVAAPDTSDEVPEKPGNEESAGEAADADKAGTEETPAQAQTAPETEAAPAEEKTGSEDN